MCMAVWVSVDKTRNSLIWGQYAQCLCRYDTEHMGYDSFTGMCSPVCSIQSMCVLSESPPDKLSNSIHEQKNWFKLKRAWMMRRYRMAFEAVFAPFSVCFSIYLLVKCLWSGGLRIQFQLVQLLLNSGLQFPRHV